MNFDKIPDSSRILFFDNYQQELISLARKKALERFPHEPWRKVVAKIIARSPRMVYHYRFEESVLTAWQIRSLANFVPLPIQEINKRIAKVRENYEWCSDGGKACIRKHGKSHYTKIGRVGGKIVGNMLFRKYGAEYYSKKGKLGGKLGFKTILQKYGVNQLREWNCKAAPIGGIKSAESQPPTEQQKRLAKHNLTCSLAPNVDFKINHTIKFGDGAAYNFDFVYFKNSLPLALEEVTSIAPSRGDAYSRSLDVIERKRWLREHGLDIPIIHTVARVKNVGREFKFPADIILVLMEEGVIPVFEDDLNSRADVIRCLFGDRFPLSYIYKIREWALGDIQTRRRIMERLARGEKNKPMNQTELLVNEKLHKSGLSPQGKVILRSLYGTFMVPDNHFDTNGVRWYVFVSRASKSSLKSHIAHHAGHSFMLKRIFDPYGKCVVFISGDNVTPTLHANNKWMKYLSKYSETVILGENLDMVESLIRTHGGEA